MSLYDVNKILNYIEFRMSIKFILEMKKSFTQKITLKKMNRLLFAKFKDLLQIFDFNLIEKLSSHKTYNHKIELEKNFRTIKNRMYSMFHYKLLKLKKYLNENLKKSFIIVNSTFFVFFVLFVTKFNDSFRFCVDYRKFNAIIKRNKYFISLIEKTLIKVINFKYFIKLNIIIVFNKLRMNSDSENFITFIIFLNFYKYKILFFEFINDSINYQHYMNDVLWNYINDFVQCYLNNILIYNKTRKTHVKHMKIILERFREINLQMNIIKSEFFVKKTTFFDVIVSTNDIRMNLKKIQVIVDWMTSANLKKIQIFLNFCNFYRRFIRNFVKIVNKHRKLIKYNFEDKVWLFNNNIITIRPFKKLENKMLKSFEIIKAVDTFYKLKLLIFIKIHFVFHISLFRSNLNDFLFDQIIDASKSIKIVNENEWLVNDILNSRRHYDRLQYKIK